MSNLIIKNSSKTRLSLVLLGVLFVSICAAQLNDDSCKSNAHSVTSLPYWDGKTDLPCMYAGTVNVSKDANITTQNHNLFYWLFKNSTVNNTGLVFWLNGGPGSSSMFGLFLENGPLRVTRTGTGSNDYVVSLTDHHWGQVADVVFLDQPVGTGFSYGTPLNERMEQGAEDVL